LRSSPSARVRASVVVAIATGLVVATAHADLPAWMQQVVGASSIEAALYRTMQLPGAGTLYPRPPAEARAELTALVTKSPADANLYALRAHADEQSLDFVSAEADWKSYVSHAQDAALAQLELADYYERRLQPQQEIMALTVVAAAPSPATKRFTPVEQQRSWKAYGRILKLTADQALPPETTFTTYNAWITRYPTEPSVRAALVNTLIHQQRFDEATAAIAAYKTVFPQDAVFPVKAAALVAYRSGSPAKALTLYDASFQPLWPAELVQSYFGMLAAQHQQRTMLTAARVRLAQNPDDLGSAARIFFYFQQQGNLAAASRAFEEYRLSKEQRKASWSADELYTIATLLNGVGFYEQTARYDYALYNTSGKLSLTDQAPQEAALSSIVNLLLTAPEQSIGLGSGNLSMYRDIATVDRGPGYLNGILSLWLNSNSPASEFHDEEQRATPYFRRAKAAELLALLDKSYPNASARPALHAALIRASSSYGGDAATITAAKDYLATFPNAAERVPVTIMLADAYARTNNATAEFALYDSLLAELARKSQGQPLTASAAITPLVNAAPHQDQQGEDVAPAPVAAKPDLDRALDLTTTHIASVPLADDLSYSQLLERYLGRLTTTKHLPEALAVLRHEIDRNPDDPLLYARLADFLQQNNLAAQQEEVFRRAIARFPGTGFYDKLARFYLRQQRQQDFAMLTRQVVDTFVGTELEGYFSNVNQSWPQVYLQLNLYAHQRFPHELRFTRNLLGAYQTRATADPAAYDLLLRQHWFEASDLRDQFFDSLSRTGKLAAELAALQQLVPSAAQQQQNSAATRELAEANLWQSHFEVAAPLLGGLAHAYPADIAVGDEASSVYRSLAYFDPAKITNAVAVEKNLIAADPANVDRLARIGDIYADAQSTALSVSAQTQLAAASPYWRRIPGVHPGQADGYLQAATIFWDYFQFDDALTELSAARKQFHDPALYGYEAGAIAENKNASAQAVAEYVTASVAGNSSARARLLTLAGRPSYAKLIDEAMAKAAATNPSLTALSLRADILTVRRQQTSIAALMNSAIEHAGSSEQAAQLADFAQQHRLTASYRHALEREVVLSADPVQRIQLQYALAQSFTDDKDVASAQTIIDSVHRDNPKLLGVVRATTDFYWTNKQPRQAIATLTQAAHESAPEFTKSFTLEAVTKSNQSGDYAEARSLLAPLLAVDPYDARYLAAEADSYALAKDDAGLRDFYAATLVTIKTANLPADVRRDKTALLRQGLIVALTHLKDYEGAADQHIALISAFPEDTGIAQSAALYALQYDRKQQLAAFLNKTVTDSPRDSRFVITLARVDTLFEDYAGALAAYGNAIAIRKDRADLYIARADLEEHQQSFDAACTDYDRLYVLTYKDPQWMLKTAEARARQGKNDLAIHALQTAYIDGRPKSAQNEFKVAAQLEQWNLLDQARNFAEQGILLQGADFLASSDGRDGPLLYARILTRQRHVSEAISTLQASLAAVAATTPSSLAIVVQQAEKQGLASVTDDEWRKNLVAQRNTQAQSGFQGALRRVSQTVAEFYTPEEKLAYAQLLDGQRADKSAEEVAGTWIPAAEAAGLKDREAQWRKDLLLVGGKIGDAQLGPYDSLEQQRMDNAVRARTLEAYAATRPVRTRESVLTMALNAWMDEGDTASELRLLRSLNLRTDDHAAQRDLYFQLLLRSDQKTLLTQASSTNSAYADAAANFMFANASQSLAQSAIDARAHGRAPVWSAANVALAGLFFADTSSRTNAAFHAALADKTIAERLVTQPDRAHQLVGEDWFYYGMRYGVYRMLATSAAGDSEDFLAAGLEASPTRMNSYLGLAQSYVDAHNTSAALEEYRHALELAPNSADIHRSIAVLLWSTNHHAEAIAEWQQSLALLRKLVDVRAVPESFWTDFVATANDAQSNGIGEQLRPDMDNVLRGYITKNGNYRSAELLHYAYIALTPSNANTSTAIDWVFSLADAAHSPSSVLEELDSPYSSNAWFPKAFLGRLYRRQLELAQREASQKSMQSDASADATSGGGTVSQSRLKLLTWLLQQRQSAEAQSLYDTIPASDRMQETVQQARILLAARQSRVPALIAAFTSDSGTAPSLELIANTASQLRTAGDTESSRSLLEYVFQRKLAEHVLTPPDYLALAQARLDRNDAAAALELLHRLVQLPSSGDGSGTDLYANLDSAASLLERSSHPAEALPFLTALTNATPWNPGYRLRLARLQLKTSQTAAAAVNSLIQIASSAIASYGDRTQAALALKSTAGMKQFDSAELTLLAASAITPQQASKPYFVAARIAAADAAPAAAKPALLREAMAIAPSDDLRLAIFRTEFALGHNALALAAIKPLLQSGGGYYQPLTSELDDTTTYDAASAQLPGFIRSAEERVVFAQAIAALYEKDGDDANSVTYLNTAASLNHDAARAKTIAANLAAVQARIQLAVANLSRRPIIQAGLSQSVVVRPRLTSLVQQVQP
jgi:cellulose synthase operon protein C